MAPICLALSLTTCGRKEPPTVTVPQVIRVTVPEAHARDTDIPVIGGDTNGDLLRERDALLDALESCNADKAAIRKVISGMSKKAEE